MSIGINKKRDEKLCINIEEDSMLDQLILEYGCIINIMTMDLLFQT